MEARRGRRSRRRRRHGRRLRVGRLLLWRWVGARWRLRRHARVRRGDRLRRLSIGRCPVGRRRRGRQHRAAVRRRVRRIARVVRRWHACGGGASARSHVAVSALGSWRWRRGGGGRGGGTHQGRRSLARAVRGRSLSQARLSVGHRSQEYQVLLQPCLVPRTFGEALHVLVLEHRKYERTIFIQHLLHEVSGDGLALVGSWHLNVRRWDGHCFMKPQNIPPALNCAVLPGCPLLESGHGNKMNRWLRWRLQLTRQTFFTALGSNSKKT